MVSHTEEFFLRSIVINIVDNDARKAREMNTKNKEFRNKAICIQKCGSMTEMKLQISGLVWGQSAKNQFQIDQKNDVTGTF